MDAEALASLFETWLARLYVDGPVKVTRSPMRGRLLGRYQMLGEVVWIMAHDGLEGRKLLEVLFHELAHHVMRHKFAYQTERPPVPGGGTEVLLAAFGKDHDPAVVDRVMSSQNLSEEAICDEWGEDQAGVWWRAIHRARSSPERWSRFLSELDDWAYGSPQKSGLAEARRLAGLTEVQLLIAELEGAT